MSTDYLLIIVLEAVDSPTVALNTGQCVMTVPPVWLQILLTRIICIMLQCYAPPPYRHRPAPFPYPHFFLHSLPSPPSHVISLMLSPFLPPSSLLPVLTLLPCPSLVSLLPPTILPPSCPYPPPLSIPRPLPLFLHSLPIPPEFLFLLSHVSCLPPPTHNCLNFI